MTDPSNETRVESSGRKWWIRLALATAVVLLPILCAISQPGLVRLADGYPFSQFPTPTATATLPPSVVLHNRTLHLPVLAVGNPCPVTASHVIDDGGAVMGVGPVYLIAQETTVYFAPAQSQSSHGWGAGRLTFAIHNSLHGLVLVRGRQLDGAHEIRFGLGEIPDTELLFRTPADSSVNSDLNSVTYTFDTIRLFEAGCYAVQVDNEEDSDVIVFRAESQQG